MYMYVNHIRTVCYLCMWMCFQITVKASDHGEPPRSAEVGVTVSISQDSNQPSFQRSEYRMDDVAENLPVGSSIIRVSASDDDVNIQSYYYQKKCL